MPYVAASASSFGRAGLMRKGSARGNRPLARASEDAKRIAAAISSREGRRRGNGRIAAATLVVGSSAKQGRSPLRAPRGETHSCDRLLSSYDESNRSHE